MSATWFESDPRQMPLGKLLAWTGGALARYYQRAVAEHGLTQTSIGVLGVLGHTDAVSHRELAAHLGITPATLTPVVDALEESGELTRERDPSDRRVVRLTITERGRERMVTAYRDVEATFKQRMPHPSPEHATIVRDHLLAVLAAVTDENR